MSELTSQPGYIYFIQTANGSIKIGFAIRPLHRFATLQVGSSETLTLLGVFSGTRVDEKRLHKQLEASWVRGEWFHPSPEVMALAAQLGQAPSIPKPEYPGVHHAIERESLEAAIKSTHGNLTASARALGCSRRTLQIRMRKYGMAPGKAGRKHKIVGNEP
jgi:hypothetical protein